MSMRAVRLIGPALCAVMVVCAGAYAERIELIDGSTLSDVIVESIDPGSGVHLAQDRAPIELARIRHIERDVERQSPPLRAARLFLRDGSVVIARSVAVEGGEVAFDAIVGAGVRWPLQVLRGLSLMPLSADAQGRPRPEPAFAEAMADANSRTDRLFVVRDDGLTAVSGALAGLDADGASFIWSGEKRRVSRDKLYGVVLASTGAPNDGPKDATRVHMADGSTIQCTQVRLRDGRLTLELDDRSALEVKWSEVRELQHDSARLAYLSDLPTVSTEVDAKVTYAWPPRRDAAVTGDPLRLNGRTYHKGIGMHAPTSMTWSLEGNYEHLVATIGLDDGAAEVGDCVFVVQADGRTIYEQRMRGGDSPRRYEVSVAGVDRLMLEVRAGANLDIADHADWADARLIRAHD